jgi:DNA-binding transcriptional regulator of glucitol operon
VYRLLSPPWLVRHAATLTLVAAFLALGWWQLGRARAGNTLSYAYAVQWPLFAAFVVGVWVREVRAALGLITPAAAPEERVRPVVVPYQPAAQPAVEDAELSAYNDYLAWLSAHPDRRPSDYHRGD